MTFAHYGVSIRPPSRRAGPDQTVPQDEDTRSATESHDQEG